MFYRARSPARNSPDGVKERNLQQRYSAEGDQSMNRMSLFLIIAAAFSLPALADEGAAAAQKAKLITAAQAELGVPADGRMTPETRAAVKRYQRSKGIAPSGELDKRTVTALGLDGPKPKPAAGATAEAKPTTPVGPAQSSAERAAEPTLKRDQPTGNAND
jgi:peptidoglycan hydrolase-like protein with peptidoglycan-binding domain